ncbi:hypothetical protein EMN47_01445 [Prolixibacteraceae bacterium JC049]|nr:hypothetical protein [Prolixibacteraceae bacterium JC049]
MGIAYTLDTPIKVAHYGISSAISLVDDMLMEKMREYYSNKLNIPFNPISSKSIDHRAERITAYLNMVDKVVKQKFDDVKQSIQENKSEFSKYLDMLPNLTEVKQEFSDKLSSNVQDLKNWANDNLSIGSIDVNIMTKLDKTNFHDGDALPQEYNDAHAALRGFANSTLRSSVVLSAGMNPRLYSYLEEFDDFYPDANGDMKKKIILKVSDYRSALLQGKIFAKKGLWVSEYRIESGLNCGGHAFASDGQLMGPVLEAFKNNRAKLIEETFELYQSALKQKERFCTTEPPVVRITAQGGVGSAQEHQFLLDHYQLDSVGWGSPFLLCPEASTIDEDTLHKLQVADEKDIYLSNISPLGVPFNSLKGNTKDLEKAQYIQMGRPGSPCVRKHASVNREFTDHEICTASRAYQRLKLKELEEKNLPPEEHRKAFDQIVEKSCICVGLGTPALISNNLDTKTEGPGVSVCPGPNLAYFTEKVSLKKMVDHIYGRAQVLKKKRPNLFLKELNIYTDYLKEKLSEVKESTSPREIKTLTNLQKNLMGSVEYYNEMKEQLSKSLEIPKKQFADELNNIKNRLSGLFVEMKKG